MFPSRNQLTRELSKTLTSKPSIVLNRQMPKWLRASTRFSRKRTQQTNLSQPRESSIPARELKFTTHLHSSQEKKITTALTVPAESGTKPTGFPWTTEAGRNGELLQKKESHRTVSTGASSLWTEN